MAEKILLIQEIDADPVEVERLRLLPGVRALVPLQKNSSVRLVEYQAQDSAALGWQLEHSLPDDRDLNMPSVRLRVTTLHGPRGLYKRPSWDTGTTEDARDTYDACRRESDLGFELEAGRDSGEKSKSLPTPLRVGNKQTRRLR